MTWSVNGYDEYLLAHEQLHFDINELLTRRLAAAFYSAVYTDNFKTEIEEIYKKNRAELGAMEAKYDGESQHSQNGRMQTQWNLFIYWQLKKLPSNY